MSLTLTATSIIVFLIAVALSGQSLVLPSHTTGYGWVGWLPAAIVAIDTMLCLARYCQHHHPSVDDR